MRHSRSAMESAGGPRSPVALTNDLLGNSTGYWDYANETRASFSPEYDEPANETRAPFAMLFEDFSDYFYGGGGNGSAGLLARSDVFEFGNCSANGSAANASACGGAAPARAALDYNLWALVLVLFPCLTLFGNVLVIMSVVRERTLQTVTNYFIVSLAIADLLVAVVVMPFAVYYLFLGSWALPPFVCDFYIAMDVTCSTSSIYNLVAISIDRYIAVTQPIKYAKHKNNRRVWLTIVLVWLISAAIGLPMLGLNHTPLRSFDQCLFYNSDYVIYSSLSSFYIPCIMMIFLYYSIFKALRTRARKQRAARRPPAPGVAAVVIENVLQTRRLAETPLDKPSGSNEDEDEPQESFDRRSPELDADADDCHVIPNDKSSEFILASVTEETGHAMSQLSCAGAVEVNGAADSGYAASHPDECRAPTNGTTASPHHKRTNGMMVTIDGRIKHKAELPECSSKEDSKKERKASSGARFTIYKVNKASKKKREKSSAKKERKATKTLAIVLGVFLFCWAPFFTCNIMDAVCSKLQADCSPGVTAFILTTWLGYMNSFVNPIIYTIFNPEFRKAFKKLMHMGT